MKSKIRISILLAAVLAATGPAHALEWAQYQGNAQHTGFADVQIVGNLTAAWSKNLGYAVNPVAAAGGSVFLTTRGYFSGQHLLALDAKTGEQRWSKDFGGVFSVNPPSYSNGNVYLQTGNHGSDSYFRGYNAGSGALVVKSPFSAQWEHYEAPTIFNGKAYVNGGYYGGIYAFDLASGEQRWFTGLEQYDGWTPAVNEKYVVTYTGGNLRVLDHDTGAIEQTIADPRFSWAGWTSGPSPVLAGDHAFNVNSGFLTSFDLVNGDIDWHLSGVTGQIAVDGNEIFALRNGTLSSIDATTGQVNWMWEDSADSSLHDEILATRNLLFVSGGERTYVIDRASRSTVQILSEGGRFALDDDYLYIATSTGLSVYNLSAVPEVETAALVLAGLAVLTLVRRKPATA